MATSQARVSVTTSATQIATLASGGYDQDARSFLIKNATGTDVVYLGASDVTAANGFAWATTDAPVAFTLEPGESLYGIVATTTQVIHVLSTGRTKT